MTMQPSRFRSAAETFTLLITNATKILGLASAFNQLLITDHPTPLALAVSAFMIAGGQFSEGLILTLLDRLIGGAPVEHEKAG